MATSSSIYRIRSSAALAVTLAAAAVIVWLLCFNPAPRRQRQPRPRPHRRASRCGWLDNLFVVLIAVVVMLAIQWVGLLIINAMLILPAAAARNVAGQPAQLPPAGPDFRPLLRRPRPAVSPTSIAVAAGPTIVLVAAALFFGTFFVRSKMEPVWPEEKQP